MKPRSKIETHLAQRRVAQRALLRRFIAIAERDWLAESGVIRSEYRLVAFTYFKAIYDFERDRGSGPFVVQDFWIRSFQGGCIYIKAKQLLAMMQGPVRPHGKTARVIIDEYQGDAA